MRMLLTIAALAPLLAMPGCVDAPINDGMSKMVGKPLDAAIAKLGMPNREETIAGRKVYSWTTSNLVEGTAYRCEIRVIMLGEMIGTFSWQGNNGGCIQYASLLGR